MEGRSQVALGKYNNASRLSAAPTGAYFSMIRSCQRMVSTARPARGSVVGTTLALPEQVVATRSFPIRDGSTGPGPSRGGSGGGSGVVTTASVEASGGVRVPGQGAYPGKPARWRT